MWVSRQMLNSASECSSGHHSGAAENKARCVSPGPGWPGKMCCFCPVSGLSPAGLLTGSHCSVYRNWAYWVNGCMPLAFTGTM